MKPLNPLDHEDYIETWERPMREPKGVPSKRANGVYQRCYWDTFNYKRAYLFSAIIALVIVIIGYLIGVK